MKVWQREDVQAAMRQLRRQAMKVWQREDVQAAMLQVKVTTKKRKNRYIILLYLFIELLVTLF
jgi:hypothetical protein